MENTHYRENSDGNSSDRGNVRGGFGNPSYQNTGTRNQEYEERNDNSIRSRHHDKCSEDHMRDSSPDRNDRTRHRDKQNEDHVRDQSPDRSSNEKYTQGAEYGTNNKSVNWNQSQSQHYQGNHENSGQGYQQGYEYQFDRKRDYYRDYSGSQGQGRYGAHGNQQSSNWNYKHNKDWNQQEQYGYWDGNKQKEFQKDRRSRNRVSEDHMRDSSPDRNDRARPKDKQYEDHARDQSPDRSSNEQYTQGAECGTNNKSINWNQSQSQHYQGNHENSGQGYQQGYEYQFDRKRDYYRDYSDSQGQGRYGAHGNQQSSNWKYKHNKDWNQQEQYGYWDGNKQKEFQKDRRSRNRDEKSDIHLSKALSFLLRHGAERQGYKLMPGGFLYVDEILQKQTNLQDYNLEDIQRIEKSNDKQRFFMEEDKETGKMKIRANQFHSLQVENLDLKPLLSHEEAPVVIHGTYHNSWEKIKLTGLSRMGRNHIHFAAGEPGENGVISGMRSSCEVMIYINLQKALEGGLKFFWSANNVILSPGNEYGVIPPAYFDMAVLRNPRQRLDFDQNVTTTRVPVGGESLAQSKSKKKEKKKGKTGEGENDGGIENIFKKENNEIDDSAIEDTGSLFNEEKIEVQEEYLQRVVEKMEVKEQKAPEKWDEVAEQRAAQKKWNEDAVQVQDDEFHDAEDGSDVIDEPIVIEDAPASVCAVYYLKDQEVVVVYCDQLEDTFSKIVCAVSDKFYIFDIQKSPDIMSEGKLAEFFNNSQEPWKVFHGLTSRICATFFEKFEIILDGTMIFDLKMAYDMMKTQGLGNMTELKQTRYDPESVPTSLESCDVMAYLKGFQYLDKMMKKAKDYKKQLFQMVNAEICKDEMKKLREQRKKELKTPPPPSKRKMKNKK